MEVEAHARESMNCKWGDNEKQPNIHHDNDVRVLIQVYLHGMSLPGRYPRNTKVLEYPTVQKLHNIERRANYAIILAETIGLWNRYVCLLQGVYDAVFSLDSVGSFGQQLPWRLLAHDILDAVAVFELVGWVGLPIAELFDFQGRLDDGHVLVYVATERVDVNGLADGAGHGCCCSC